LSGTSCGPPRATTGSEVGEAWAAELWLPASAGRFALPALGVLAGSPVGCGVGAGPPRSAAGPALALGGGPVGIGELAAAEAPPGAAGREAPGVESAGSGRPLPTFRRSGWEWATGLVAEPARARSVALAAGPDVPGPGRDAGAAAGVRVAIAGSSPVGNGDLIPPEIPAAPAPSATTDAIDAAFKPTPPTAAPP
jgi:hypothetical protein